MTNSQILQLQASYSSEQDRLLLRINTSDHAEFRFWLTRRFVRRLWQLLRNHLERQHRLANVESNARAAVLEFMHQNITAQADFKAPFKETTQTVTPLGQEPILVVMCSIQPVKDHDELFLVSLHPAQGYGIELAMDTQLMHGFCKLMADALTDSEWGLDWGFVAMQANQEVVKQERPLLH